MERERERKREREREVVYVEIGPRSCVINMRVKLNLAEVVATFKREREREIEKLSRQINT